MLSKRARFQQWRGSNFNEEQKYINAAELVNDYVDSVETFAEIRVAFKGIHPQKFKEFERFKGRSLGVVTFFKLTIDEAREQFFSESGDTPLYQALTNLNNLLASIYERPKTLSSKDAQDVFNAIELLLQIDDAFFVKKHYSKKLFFSLYTIVHLVEPAFNALGSIARRLVSLRIDIDKSSASARDLLLKIEAKAQLLEHNEEHQGEAALSRFVQMEGYFNERYLNLIHDEAAEMAKGCSVAPQTLAIINTLSLLAGKMQQNSANITHFMALRTHKEGLESKIEAIKGLLDAAIANDQQVLKRDYFLDLLATNRESYLIFRDSLPGEQKDSFLEKVTQLTKAVEGQDLSIKINRSFSWISAPFSQVYRTALPQLVQDMIAVRVPATLDSACKLMLKALAADCLMELNSELAVNNQQLEDLGTQLFANENKLKRALFTEPLSTLSTLQQKADVARKAVHAYQRLFFSIKENMDFLHKYQGHAENLGEFIRINNNFWIKLSNFFAQFLEIFKTDAARSIDAAQACQHKVAVLAAKYQNAIQQEMQQIEDDQSLDETVKHQLKEHFSAQMNEAHAPQPNKAPLRTREVRLLIMSLSRLFATSPEPMISKYPTEDEPELGTSPQPAL